MDRELRSTLLFLLGSVLALLLVYSGSFQNGFHYDDFHSIVDNPHIRDLARIPAFFWQPEMFSAMPERAMYRPLLLASYAFNHWAGGYEVWGYHLVNWALHLGCSLLVYWLGRSIGGLPLAAALGGLLFALHPVNSEVVNYISSRSESLAALFFLVALLAYIGWRRKCAGLGLYGLSLLAYGGALAGKSIAVVLPAALLWYEWAGGAGETRREWRDWVPWHLGYWLIAGLYILMASSWLEHSLDQRVRALDEQFPTQIKAALFYVKLLAFPTYLSVEPAFGVTEEFSTLQVLGPLLVVLTGTWLVLRRRPRGRLFLGWAVLPLLPSSLVPLNVLVNEHRLYLPGAFLAAGVGLWLGNIPLHKRGRLLLWGACLVILGTLARQRSAVWEDELSLWQDAVVKGPGMYRSHMHLGGALEQQGRLDEALYHYQRAAELVPEVVEVHYNLANGLRLAGQGEEAIEAYHRCLDLDPDFAPALFNLSALQLAGGELEAAEQALQRGLDIRPESPEGHQQLGLLRKRQGHPQEAERAFLRALSLRPDMAEVHYNLANLYFAQRRLAESALAYEKALRIRPDYGPAYRNLGDLHMRQGDFARAVNVFSRGLRQVPGEVFLYYGMARAQEAQGRNRAAAQNYLIFLTHAQLNPDVQADLRQRIRDLQRGENKGDEARP